MAKNPFKQNKDFTQRPKRNTFDLSRYNNLTMNFGTLYPVFCEPVMPGDHVRLNIRYMLRFMPLVFPVQTRIRAHAHAFYVRSRNLWDGFNDFIYGNKEHALPSPSNAAASRTSPYIDDTKSPTIFLTGQIGDYMNLPTTFNGFFKTVNGVYTYDNRYVASTSPSPTPRTSRQVCRLLNFEGYDADGKALYNLGNMVTGVNMDRLDNGRFFDNYQNSVFLASTGKQPTVQDMFTNYTDVQPSGFYYNFGLFYIGSNNYNGETTFRLRIPIGASGIKLESNEGYLSLFVGSAENGNTVSSSVFVRNVPLSVNTVYDDPNECYVYDLEATIPAGININSQQDLICAVCLPLTHIDYYNSSITFIKFLRSLPSVDYISTGHSVFNNTPNKGTGGPVSALPFRAYESIYNAFYRDARNNPFMIDDEPEYNKYLPSTSGGLDLYDYHLHRRNWELDQYTSCVQSPQQGAAPLVGITSLGEVVISDNDTGKQYKFSTETADDADTITRVNVSEDIPNSVARTVMDIATQGISINDFRNVNAFQRWKETNIRRGFKLKDQTKARWGVDISYNTLDMPEFIGGVSCDVDINSVSQTSETEISPLGSYAGQASAFGGSKNNITQYCDEHGFIMVILSIVPQPIYTQTCPRMFRMFSPLDYYNPEFGQIGMQPIYNSDIAPVQTALSGGNASDVFGYQRPWWNYLYANDEAHGLFRKSLRNFLLMREFENVPVLGKDFTTIDNSELNNIFSTEIGDKILGCMYFDCQIKRPIPAVSVPSLE